MNKKNDGSVFSLLSQREKEIAFLLLDGKKTNEIALILNVKSNTVSTLKKKVYKKIGVDSSIQLYKIAIKEGVLSMLEFV